MLFNRCVLTCTHYDDDDNNNVLTHNNTLIHLLIRVCFDAIDLCKRIKSKCDLI